VASTEGEGRTLELRATIPAPRARVFEMLTEPKLLAEWWGPRGFASEVTEQELRSGGRYRIAMTPPGGETFHLEGAYREVVPPERVSFTFIWDPPAADDRETLAELTLREKGGGTDLELLQGPFTTEQRLDLHREGWSDSLARLRELADTGRAAADG
jgi:uncharacterized protein YndB with AHSA1/START domain